MHETFVLVLTLYAFLIISRCHTRSLRVPHTCGLKTCLHNQGNAVVYMTQWCQTSRHVFGAGLHSDHPQIYKRAWENILQM